jgi:hypothetical protein
MTPLARFTRQSSPARGNLAVAPPSRSRNKRRRELDQRQAGISQALEAANWRFEVAFLLPPAEA